MKLLLLLLGLICLLLPSCGLSSRIAPASTPSIQTETKTPTAAPLPILTKTVTPAQIFTFTPNTSDKPGFIITLGEKVDFRPSGLPVFSPDGKTIALASAKIRLWDVKTHQLIRELESSYSEDCNISNALFSPDGKLFAVSVTDCDINTTSSVGHLFIWDVNSGKLLKDWAQKYAYMPATRPSEVTFDYSIPVSAMAFLPDNRTIIFSSGNTLEIRDTLEDNKPVIIDLGAKMFASQISLPTDGRFVYVIMVWTQNHDFPAYWTQKKKLQIWDMNTYIMRREINYPDGWFNLDLKLHNSSILQISSEKGTTQIFDLETDQIKELPYRTGRAYLSSDMSRIIYARLFEGKEENNIIELWDTDTWRNIYSFMPDFDKGWAYSMNGIAFSPDNTILAIEHREQVTLWNIQPVATP
jgi:WD40 repeat protein